MWYWWRIVKPTVILRCRAQFSSSIVDFATNTNVGKSHSYGSIYSFQTRPQYAACTFSILNRIDIPATIVAQVVVPRLVDFQYPQPDRYPCNSYAYTSTDVATAFQYPQPDRYPCNAVHKALPCPRPLHFQYPQPDRYPCNCLFCCGGRTQ